MERVTITVASEAMVAHSPATICRVMERIATSHRNIRLLDLVLWQYYCNIDHGHHIRMLEEEER